MAYISIFGEHFLKLPKKEILIDYISRSYDPQKAKNGDYLASTQDRIGAAGPPHAEREGLVVK